MVFILQIIVGRLAGLAACSNIIEDKSLVERCIDRMNEYFIEPIDCTEDGECGDPLETIMQLLIQL